MKKIPVIFVLLAITLTLTACEILTGEEWAEKLGIKVVWPVQQLNAFDSPVEPTPTNTPIPTDTPEPPGGPSRPPECAPTGICFCSRCLVQCLTEFTPDQCSIFGRMD